MGKIKVELARQYLVTGALSTLAAVRRCGEQGEPRRDEMDPAGKISVTVYVQMRIYMSFKLKYVLYAYYISAFNTEKCRYSRGSIATDGPLRRSGIQVGQG